MGRSTASNRRFAIHESLIRDFTYQLRLLLTQSYLLQESLQIMLSINTQSRLTKLIRLIQERLGKGKSFADSLENIQSIDHFYLTMVKSGEISGNLPDQISKLYDHLESKRLYRQKLSKASLYPAVVLSITFIAALAFILLAIPMLVNFAQSLQVSLPPSTQRFIQVMSWIQQNYLIVLLLMMLIWIVLVLFARKNPYLVDYWKCSIPFIGRIMIEKDLIVFCQQISFLLTSHLGLQEALPIATSSIQNRFLKEQLEIGSTKLDYGLPISQTLHSLFQKHPFLATALKTGEETNRLSENFAFLSVHYQQKLQQTQDRILILIEPVMLLIIGIFVFFIIVQFYLPIFQLLNQVDLMSSW